MAALDTHEQEQVEALNAWWKANGTQVTLAIALAAVVALAVFGWRYWHAQQNAKAADLFAEVVRQAGGNDPKRVDDAAAILANKYGSTVYAARGQLLAAEVNVLANNSAVAAGELHWVIENSSDEGLQHAARLQLASLFLDEQKYDDALKLLDAAHPESFDSLYLNLKGDVYAAEGKNDAARGAYKGAIEKAQSKGKYVTAIQLKLEALGGELPGAAPGKAAPAASAPGAAK